MPPAPVSAAGTLQLASLRCWEEGVATRQEVEGLWWGGWGWLQGSGCSFCLSHRIKRPWGCSGQSSQLPAPWVLPTLRSLLETREPLERGRG